MAPDALTADVLADLAAATPDPEGGPGQWVYRKSAVVPVPDMAGRPAITERWATADGTVGAAYVDGQLEIGPWSWPVPPGRDAADPLLRRFAHPAGGTAGWRSPLELPAIGYGELSGLPADPVALARLLADTPVPRDDESWNAGHAFEIAAELLESYLVPASVTASLYRAIGQLPGVVVSPMAADAAGRHGPAFLLAGRPGGNQRISVSAADGRFTGYQFLGDGIDLTEVAAWGVAILELAPVTGPGEYP
ncbi:MAG TPA: hypothetical protein VKU39_01420 [Streptosporangiaceae bacterium]|nr:hypothetical protein [Streptosporangiaceae bacterium]